MTWLQVLHFKPLINGSIVPVNIHEKLQQLHGIEWVYRAEIIIVSGR